MKAIVAVEKNWGIGYQGRLLTHIPADLRYFKEKTINKAVIMGRRTFESLPGRQPLPQRHNIILTRDADYQVRGAVVLRSKEAVLEYVKNMQSADVFVIGGEQVYKLFMPETDEIYVTRIDYNYASDVYFPNLDMLPEWAVTAVSPEQTHFDISYTWKVYRRRRG
ncbi:MAG: dihydrofolate reductase [Eubacteriales bacterium]|nr:dihydrofolate reductase [Eubacteriales bacterium]